MPENPPEKKDLPPEREKLSGKKETAPEKSAWSTDQKEKKYYYDDAHGYEVFDPDQDDAEEN
jgi:hypothetical protein